MNLAHQADGPSTINLAHFPIDGLDKIRVAELTLEQRMGYNAT
jgi:hypothetical protein